VAERSRAPALRSSRGPSLRASEHSAHRALRRSDVGSFQEILDGHSFSEWPVFDCIWVSVLHGFLDMPPRLASDLDESGNMRPDFEPSPEHRKADEPVVVLQAAKRSSPARRQGRPGSCCASGPIGVGCLSGRTALVPVLPTVPAERIRFPDQQPMRSSPYSPFSNGFVLPTHNLLLLNYGLIQTG
jgi:hypothetical protein